MLIVCGISISCVLGKQGLWPPFNGEKQNIQWWVCCKEGIKAPGLGALGIQAITVNKDVDELILQHWMVSSFPWSWSSSLPVVCVCSMYGLYMWNVYRFLCGCNELHYLHDHLDLVIALTWPLKWHISTCRDRYTYHSYKGLILYTSIWPNYNISPT